MSATGRQFAWAIFVSGRRLDGTTTASRDQAVREAAHLRSTYRGGGGFVAEMRRPTIAVRRVRANR